MTENRQRRFRFSLRTFLVVFTLLAISLSMWSLRAQRQRSAVEWITSKGGQVLYRYDRETAGVSNDGYISNASLPVPEFVLNVLDLHYFTTATLVNFENSDLLDLTQLKALKKMDTLILRDTETKDFAPLINHTGLTNLVIQNSPLNDLTPLSNIPNLESLTLENVRAKELAPICNNKTLKLLHIRKCDFADYSSLSKLSSLNYLWLENTSIKNLAPLEQLQLKFLGLENIDTSDLSPLASLRQLETIHLTLLPTQDVSPLMNHPNLKNILIARMPVTQTQVDELQKSLPTCKIDFYPQNPSAR